MTPGVRAECRSQNEIAGTELDDDGGRGAVVPGVDVVGVVAPGTVVAGSPVGGVDVEVGERAPVAVTGADEAVVVGAGPTVVVVGARLSPEELHEKPGLQA